MKYFKKTIKILGISFVIILLLMVLLPFLLPDTIKTEVKKYANVHLSGELYFEEAGLTFFKHFPYLTLTLEDFLLEGSEPFSTDTLVAAKEVSLGINVTRLIFKGEVVMNKIFVRDGTVNILVNRKGEPNYNVYQSSSQNGQDSSEDASLKLNLIQFENINLSYDDLSTGILMRADGFNYVGKGDLDQQIFDLQTKAEISSFDFAMGGQEYLKNKKVNARLKTKINTQSLSFIFEENNLKINKLPVDFKGKLDFLKNGYGLDFEVLTENSSLNDFFTALPPEFIQWLETKTVKGKTNAFFSLKGNYIVEENKSPDMVFKMNIRDGFINAPNAPHPASAIFLDIETRLPSLDPEQFFLKLDSLYFKHGKDEFSALIKSQGLSHMEIRAKVKTNIDLDQLQKSVGLPDIKFGGKLIADININGQYDKGQGSFPKTNGLLELKNGKVKGSFYPNPISDIQLKVNLQNSTGKYENTIIAITPASLVFEGQPFLLKAHFQNLTDVQYELSAKGALDIAKMYKVIYQEGVDVKGYVDADVYFKGKISDAQQSNWANLDNRGTLSVRDIKTSFDFLPFPVMIHSGTFAFDKNTMDFQEFKASYGSSDFSLSGNLQNVIHYYLSENEKLYGDFYLKSTKINLNEFLPQTPQVVKSEKIQEEPLPPMGVFQLPQQTDISFSASMDEVLWDQLALEDIQGRVSLTDGVFVLDKTSFSIIDCKVVMQARYQNFDLNRASFEYGIKAENFDVKRAYNEIDMFRTIATAAAAAEGIISINYQLKGDFDALMNPIYPSLEGGGVLSVKNVKMNGFRLFNAVSKSTETEALKDADLSEIKIKSKLKNNVLNLEQFRFKVAGFRPRIEGQTSLDGQLNLKMRLGLPPFGIIGIPLTVTGTHENPEVKLGRKSEDLEELKYLPEDERPIESSDGTPEEEMNTNKKPE